jgi:hypothetical protein
MKIGDERPSISSTLYGLLAWPMHLWFGTICAGAVLTLGWALLRRRAWPFHLPVLLFASPTAFVALFYLLFHTEDRYNHLVMPYMIATAALGIEYAAAYGQRRRI